MVLMSRATRLLQPAFRFQRGNGTAFEKTSSFPTPAFTPRWCRPRALRDAKWRLANGCTANNDRCLCSSTKTEDRATPKRSKLKVTEYPAITLNESSDEMDGSVYTFRSVDRVAKTGKHGDDTMWDTTKSRTTGICRSDSILRAGLQSIPNKLIALLLPARYPQSVAPGYLGFASFCFIASVAGSAAMVLSTQTLLLAVGIVGQNSEAAVVSGALNWVMKDFIGQLGGILFASQMGKTKAFDSDPKRWRMVAALALDGATMMEILAPICHHSLVLPVASIANIGKNIGFLTASASRAALHQSLATTGNLGDVTVKAGSQSMMASLVGTSLGISLSTLLHNDTFNFGICFVCLSAIHQVCTHLSLQSVPLARFNRHRLYLALEEYVQTKGKRMLTPADVAKKEGFFPLFASDPTLAWLSIGKPLQTICHTPADLERCLEMTPNEAYLIRFHEHKQSVDLMYFADATEEDVFRGMYHACLIRDQTKESAMAKTMHKNGLKLTDDGNEKISRERQIVLQTHLQVQEHFSHLCKEIHEHGWDSRSEVTTVEDSNGKRISIDGV